MKTPPNRANLFRSQRDFDNFRRIYDHSSTLQRIPEETLKDPLALMDTLESHRDDLNREVGFSRGGRPYTLTSFTLALATGGLTPDVAQGHIRLATGRELFNRSPILQNIPAIALASSQDALDTLEGLRPSIVEEQRTVRGVSNDALPNYALATLVTALIAGKRIDEGVLHRPHSAISRDLFNRSLILQAIGDTEYDSIEEFIDDLIRQRPAIVEEQRNVRGVSADKLPSYSLTTLVLALNAKGKLKYHVHKCVRIAGSRELYDRSPLLQGISDAEIATPFKIVSTLQRLRPAIIAEQRRVRKLPTSVTLHYALATLVQALEMGNRLPISYVLCARMAGAADLYERSSILKSIPDDAFASPRSLMETLVQLRPSIIEEQRRIRHILSDAQLEYALSTLVGALVAGGRIPENKHENYQRYVSSRDLFDRSPLLQSISPTSLSSPKSLLRTLRRLRPAIVEEQREYRKLESHEDLHYTLGTLAQALVAGGRIDDAKSFIYMRLASAQDLYDNSPILQGISTDCCSSPQALIAELVRLRPAIQGEQHERRGFVGDEQLSYALNTFVMVLIAAGKVTGDTQTFLRTCGAYDLYDRSPLLQGIPDSTLQTPQKLVDTLSSMRAHILEEQRTARDVSESDLPHYALATFIKALMAAGRIPRNAQPYQRTASARDLYERSPLLQGIRASILASPKKLLNKLIEMRPAIELEQQSIRDTSDNEDIDYSMGTLVMALSSTGKITENLQNYSRLASGYELYQRSKLLQAIPAQARSTPITLLHELIRLRPAIVEEQRKARNITDDELANYALGTFVSALEAAGRLKGKIQRYERVLGSYDLYDRSPTLQSIPREVIQDDAALMKFLLAYRDRIALENLKASKRLNADAFVFLHADEHYALTTLVESLYAANIIDEKRLGSTYRAVAGPLEYYMKRRRNIESEIGGDDSAYRRSNLVDRAKFTALRKPDHLLSNGYIARIIKWGRWFMDNQDIAVRSIYHADELAFMSLFSFRDAIEYLSPEAAGKLETAGHRAQQDLAGSRNEAVAALDEIVQDYNRRRRDGELFDNTMTYAAAQMHRLVQWNYDALPGATFNPITTHS